MFQISGLKPVALEIEDMPECHDIQDYCQELAGSRSVPKVWVNQKLIGGSDDVYRVYKLGKL